TASAIERCRSRFMSSGGATLRRISGRFRTEGDRDESEYLRYDIANRGDDNRREALVTVSETRKTPTPAPPTPSEDLATDPPADKRVRLGLRDRIPRMGLREYWYPVVADAKVPRRKPVRRTVVGDDLVLFRGTDGQVAALSNWCSNWRVSLENLNDAHVFFVHRNSIELLIQDRRGLQLFLGMGPHRPATKIVNGRALVFENPRFFDYMDTDQARKTAPRTEFQEVYPALGGAKWPK